MRRLFFRQDICLTDKNLLKLILFFPPFLYLLLHYFLKHTKKIMYTYGLQISDNPKFQFIICLGLNDVQDCKVKLLFPLIRVSTIQNYLQIVLQFIQIKKLYKFRLVKDHKTNNYMRIAMINQIHCEYWSFDSLQLIENPLFVINKKFD